MPLRIPFTEVKELQKLPLQQQQALIEEFNKSDEILALQKRIGLYPARVAAVLAMIVIGVMVLVYDIGPLPCFAAGLACFVIGIPLGGLSQILILRHRLRRFVQKRAISES